jgi:cobalt-precorrin 5A hydrolase/precorrin-3B C17-methyltransferase
VALYNPVSRTRRTLLTTRGRSCCGTGRGHAGAAGVEPGRPQEQLAYRRLADLKVDEVDMLTVVLIGSSQSRIVERGEGPRLYTPRGYAKKVMA